MALRSGTMLGPYEIQSPLGAGGMGEVYRARDSRLDRTVAVKILPAHLSTHPEARQRFDREARTISSLSHPNVCHLYDVGTQDETGYLVMEYLEGETLASHLTKGPLPLEQVLKVGIEICEGLEAAHKTGLIHRDLKPGNIMLTKSGAKLMDFGLAKTAVSPASSGLTQTLGTPQQQPLTMEGTVVGTFQYMAPEQIEGKEADARSDIFALGAVLYEMATGRRAFEGKTQASTMAAVLAADPPPISTFQPLSSPAFESTVRSCLAKDPDDRVQTVHDVKLQLQWMATSASQASGARATPQATPNRLAWLLVGLLSLVVIGGSAAWWASTHRTSAPMYFGSALPFTVNDVALSPDGRTVALVAYWQQTDKYAIWIYEVGSRTTRTISAPTEDASHPFWSPDGRSLGFFADGKLKRIDLGTQQSPQVLCDAPNGRGGTWNRDGVILFAPDVSTGLYRISSAGGTPVEVTKLDTSRSQSSNRWPFFLPDQRHFLYLGANFSGEFEKNAIFVGSLDSPETHPIVGGSSNAAYADPGYLLYVKDNNLVAQPFDLRTYSLSGEPRSLSNEVQYFPTTDLGVFSVGRGTLLVQTGKGANKSQLLWFDRSGKQSGAIGPQGRYGNVSLSPDGRRVLYDELESDGRHWDVWLRDVASEATQRLTFGPGLNQLPVWSPDGKQILYSGIRKSAWTLFIKNSDGSGGERQIAGAVGVTQGPWDWSRDGRLLTWKNGELWYTSLANPELKPIFQGNWIVRNAQFSPDGKWIAYSSNETGTREVYVSPFLRTESKWQVSRGGGTEPRWRRDGKELFYLSAEGKMIAVPVKTNGTFEAGPPLTLFQTHRRQTISALDQISYDVTADGKRFLVDTKVDDPEAAPLSIILNWASEMEK